MCYRRHDVASSAYEITWVPRIAVSFPLEVPVPASFDPTRPDSWPDMPGRFEYVGGKLLFIPPCGDSQQQTAIDVGTELNLWRRQHEEFVVGGNEAGMLLGGEVRGADAAVWRAADLGPRTGGFPRVAPLLAVEITGKDEGLSELDSKVRWYLDHGVPVVWILDPATRSARVVTSAGAVDVAPGSTMPAHPDLPGLAPRLDDFFRQLSR